MDVRAPAYLMASTRLLVGLGLLAAPRIATAFWLGDGDRTDATRIAARALGGREVALGVGGLRALRDGSTGEARRWLDAGILGDSLDATLMLASGRPLPNRIAVAGMAIGAALSGAAIRSRLS